MVDITLDRDIFTNEDWPMFAGSFSSELECNCDVIGLVYPYAKGDTKAHSLWSKQISLETLRAVEHSANMPIYAFISNQSFAPKSKLTDHKRLWRRPELKKISKTLEKSPDIRSEYKDGIRYSAIVRVEGRNISELVELTNWFKAVVFWGNGPVDLSESYVHAVYSATFPLLEGNPSRYVSWPGIVSYALQNNLLCLNLDSWSPPFNARQNAHLIFGKANKAQEFLLSLRHYLDVKGELDRVSLH